MSSVLQKETLLKFHKVATPSNSSALGFQLKEAFSCPVSRGQQATKARFKNWVLKRILPGRGGVTHVSEEGEGWGESCPPICREKRVDLSMGVKVEQAVS